MAQKSPKNKVFIVYETPTVRSMYLREGWELVDTVAEADLVQFCGGPDVDPKLYNERQHSKTFVSPDRDRKEAVVFKMASKLGTPMAGICRGGQFLNVMLGGKLYQDVNNHGAGSAKKGTHNAQDSRTGEYFDVTTSHHQMMIPNKKRWHNVFLIAREATMVAQTNAQGTGFTYHVPASADVEGVYYKEEKVMCFQPHPEYTGHGKVARRYFDYLEEFFHVGKFI